VPQEVENVAQSVRGGGKQRTAPVTRSLTLRSLTCGKSFGPPGPPAAFCRGSRRELDESGATIARLGAFVTSFLQISEGNCAGLDLNGPFSPLGSGFGRMEMGAAHRGRRPATGGLCALGGAGQEVRLGGGLLGGRCGRARCVRAGAVAFACGR
jgi:hypothetical protein